MQILRIILMVCFVFTAYTPIGEALDIDADHKHDVISEGSEKKQNNRTTVDVFQNQYFFLHNNISFKFRLESRCNLSINKT